ncbi:MAG: methyltransferase domain-containing protein [Haloechinothrix sp.]
MAMTESGENPSSPELARAAVSGDSGRDALPAGTWNVLRDRLRANDPIWLGYHVLNRTAAKVSRYFDGRARARERARDLPGVNTRDYNRLLWTNYDWSHSGEEWTPTVEWRQSVIDEVMLPQMPEKPAALEIGPGGGRWTVELQPRSASLILADISPRAIELCRERFGGCDNVSYLVTDGQSLNGVDDESIDFVWSFDVFLHIAPVDQKGYLAELGRVMRPGGVAVIHHPGDGGSAAGWRSAMTVEMFADLLRDNGLRLVRQFKNWGDGGTFVLPNPGDVITVFSKPAER